MCELEWLGIDNAVVVVIIWYIPGVLVWQAVSMFLQLARSNGATIRDQTKVLDIIQNGQDGGVQVNLPTLCLGCCAYHVEGAQNALTSIMCTQPHGTHLSIHERNQ